MARAWFCRVLSKHFGTSYVCSRYRPVPYFPAAKVRSAEGTPTLNDSFVERRQ